MNIFMRKSKSLPTNLNNYDTVIKKSSSLNNLLLDDVRTVIKTFEFRGGEPVGIYFEEINGKIVVLKIIADTQSFDMTDIVIGMELLCVNNRVVNDYKKTMKEIKTKYIDNFTNDTLKTNLPILLDKIIKKIEKLELNVKNYREKINNIK